MSSSLFDFRKQPAFRAATATLDALGYPRRHVRYDFEIAVSTKERRWPLDAVAFSDSVAHIENACVTVLSLDEAGLDRVAVTDPLRRTTAPFHLVYSARRGYDLLVSANDELVPLAESISPDRLQDAVREFSVDMRPSNVQRVKRGFSSFSHPKLAPIQPLQLMLWAEEANGELLSKSFRHALDALKRAGIHDQFLQGRLAAQLLTSRILADTGAMESCDRVKDITDAAAKKHFVDYFDAKLLRKNSASAQQAYDLFRQISFATFQPEMLRTLYKTLYTAEESRAKGRFDTPLWLTRRIWREIPVEFLPPDQRVVADLTCGWGSFLVSGVERFSVLPDMGSRRLSSYIFGNDSDDTTAELARVALLTSTGRDSWQVGHEDGREWNVPGKKKPGIIVGNPPFSSDRKRQTTAITGGRRHELANDFLQRAVDSLADGGYLAMVMPGSFVASESGPEVRKALLENCDISEVWDLPGHIFEAGVQPIVIFAKKEKGKSKPSALPVRTRICERNPSHVAALRRDGRFTRSELFPDQSRWTAARRGGKTTHVFDYPAVLSNEEWEKIMAESVPLGELIVAVPGCAKGKPSRRKPRKNELGSEELCKVQLLSKAGTTVPREFLIMPENAETLSYPNDFERPRLDSKSVFENEKIILVSDPDPSWGKRTKIAIDRNGYFPGDGFFAIAPKGDADLDILAVASVIRWKVGNAWVVEHLKTRKINAEVLRRLPVPKSLLTEKSIARQLKLLLRRVERAAIAGKIDDAAEAEMDAILLKAYKITDESVWQRLHTVYHWDEIGEQAPSFDLPRISPRADWIVEGAVEAVDVERNKLTLWLSGFDESQEVSIVQQIPGWMLRVGVKFRTMIPSREAQKGRISGTAWGVFEPANYTYLTIAEMTTRMNARMKRRTA